MGDTIKITKRKTVKGEDGHRIISLRVPTTMLEELDRLAALTGRSRNELANLLLQAALKQVTIEPDE